MTLYPVGYGRQMVTLNELRGMHEPYMHPEFARRLFNWIEGQDGRVGIGGGRRVMQPLKPGFAPPGKSFHQNQRFGSGFVGYSAVDLVHVDGDRVHRAPRWSEVPVQGSQEALRWGVHCNVGVPPRGEPWHMQCVEIDGFDSWVAAGRPDPAAGYPIPDLHPKPPPPIPEPPLEDDDMTIIAPRRTTDTRVWPKVKLSGTHTLGIDKSVIPANATAVFVQVTAADPDGPGHFILHAPGTPPPGTSDLNYSPSNAPIGNGTWVQVRDRSFQVTQRGAPAHVIVDVKGYTVR